MQIESQCLTCTHFIDNGEFTCSAYPEGIPRDILFNQTPHDKIRDDQEGKDVYKGPNSKVKQPGSMLGDI